MNVAAAEKRIEEINRTRSNLILFIDLNKKEIGNDVELLKKTVSHLTDYMNTLERAMKKAELVDIF